MAQKSKKPTSQTFKRLLRAKTTDEILSAVTACSWEAGGNEGNAPLLTPQMLKDWMPPLRSDRAMRWVVHPPDDIDSLPEPKEWDDAAHYQLRRCLRQHTIDVPDKTEVMFPDEHPLHGQEVETVLNELEIIPRVKAMHAMVAILDTWADVPFDSLFMQKYGVQNFEQGIEAIHLLWQKVNHKHPGEFVHPLTPILRQWLNEHTAKQITTEYDRKHTAAIIDRASMGSIRDFIVPSTANWREELGNLKGISAPAPHTRQLHIPEVKTQSYLPAVLPLQAVHIVDELETTKRGAVAMPIRLFFESIMALEPKETTATIRFRLGDMLQYLNPNGKYHRAKHLPYVLKGLHNLYFLRIPYRENPNKPTTEVDWIPVLPRTVPNPQSGDDASIILEVKLPPDAISGMMVEKEIVRLTGKQSSSKLNAYLAACGIFDRYGTSRKGITDPTRSVEVRDSDGFLLDEFSQRFYDERGKPIANIYHPIAVRKLKREPNPHRSSYPILSFDELARACFPKGYTRREKAKYCKRALAAWQSLEADGIVRIEKIWHGWRIMPSESHIGRYRAIVKQRD